MSARPVVGGGRGEIHMRLKSCLPCLAILLFAGRAFCADASMFRGNAEHSGVYKAAGVRKFSKVKWKFHTAGQVIASPAVAGGTIYVGSTDGNLYAVDREAGALKWKFEAKSRIASSAAVSDGLVYFGAYDGNFYAVDGATGQLKWKFSTAGERRFSATKLYCCTTATEKTRHPLGIFLIAPIVLYVVWFICCCPMD